jgi:5-methyltetrahydropteroyltriglutamate--homocysteine methyltransferase
MPGKERAMQSVDRFLTTHTGSLPRPDDLIEMVIATQRGDDVDPAVLEDRITSAVFESTRRQVEAGVDIINDGEMSKPSYATYVLQRLTGFGGSSNSFPFADLKEFPRVAARVTGDPGRKYRKTPGCNAPVAVSDFDAAKRDMDRLAGGQRSWGEADVHGRGVAWRHLLLLQE